ncbi:hypothetical protein MKX03_037736, partial [Papaver bracteatum]
MFRPARNDYRAYFNWNTDITPLGDSSGSIPRHKFDFTELENLVELHVVGVLTSHTNLQQFKRNSGNTSFMRELTLENLSGTKIKVTLWGDSTSELTRNLAAHELNPCPVVAVVTGVYVKQYLGKASFSSTNATRVYFDIDIPEVLHIRERYGCLTNRLSIYGHDFVRLSTNDTKSSHRTPPREITVPVRVGYNEAAKSIGATTVSISQLVEAKWESGYNLLNRRVCRAKAIGISIEKGWYYLGCHNCTTKLVGNTGDHWCPSYKVQIDEPVPRLEVEDSSCTAFFVAMDSEAEGFGTVKGSFESLIGVFQDYHILITPFNMKFLGSPSFTVA